MEHKELTREQIEWCESHMPAFKKAADQAQAAVADSQAYKARYADQLEKQKAA